MLSLYKLQIWPTHQITCLKQYFLMREINVLWKFYYGCVIMLIF